MRIHKCFMPESSTLKHSFINPACYFPVLSMCFCFSVLYVIGYDLFSVATVVSHVLKL